MPVRFSSRRSHVPGMGGEDDHEPHDTNDSDEQDICGVTTQSGNPCQHPAGDNGFCWIPSHNPPEDRNPDSAPGAPRRRPTKAEQEEMATILERGGSIAEACRTVNVHRETFYKWMERGERQEEGPEAEFADRLTRARGAREHRYRNLIMQIAVENGEWRPLMSMLKQREPDIWGDIDPDEIGAGGGDVIVEIKRQVIESTSEAAAELDDPDTIDISTAQSSTSEESARTNGDGS